MLNLITINEHSKVPKYLQIVNSIFGAIENGSCRVKDKLPSVNEILIEFDVSRDTIVRAYDYLKEKGIIESVPGKGFYIININLKLKAKVFLLFNKLSAHKKIIYDAFSKALEDSATIEFFIYDNNYKQFKNLILASKAKNYTHYVIIPHFEDGGDDLVKFLQNEIPMSKLIIMDKKINGLGDGVACVYQDFEKNIYTSLLKLNPLLKKYNKLKLMFWENSYQPVEIINGFVHFCGEYAYDFEIIENIETEEVTKNTVYINLKEDDLVLILKKIKNAKYILGKDVGIISYNDTPIKEILLNGITVISTDFQEMGRTVAKLVLEKQKKQISNPFYVITRESL